MNFVTIYLSIITFWHGIGTKDSSSDLFKEYLSKLLLETGSRGIRPVSFFLPTLFLSQPNHFFLNINNVGIITLAFNYPYFPIPKTVSQFSEFKAIRIYLNKCRRCDK